MLNLSNQQLLDEVWSRVSDSHPHTLARIYSELTTPVTNVMEDKEADAYTFNGVAAAVVELLAAGDIVSVASRYTGQANRYVKRYADDPELPSKPNTIFVAYADVRRPVWTTN